MKLLKKSRLSDRKAIALVFQKPKYKVQNRSGLLLGRENGLEFSRIVIIVGKKHIRRAVDRNRLKRVLRVHFQTEQSQLNKAPTDLVFVARKGALDTLWAAPDVCELGKLWVKLQRLLHKTV